ncbi:hypothetical protein KY290_018569 [Solanum tuberosum]|uniref:Uncharacterized protein n=1 Tax=Solanum tuberosum TaxID=4113 RepID=A0ABQ7VEW3_SOLTU|nr:hypothetical protein KY289_017686 [Solanum tuberosum]KAH0762496.1 hypothetical protein KY290_018569 [Solanum tuberosum]
MIDNGIATGKDHVNKTEHDSWTSIRSIHDNALGWDSLKSEGRVETRKGLQLEERGNKHT